MKVIKELNPKYVMELQSTVSTYGFLSEDNTTVASGVWESYEYFDSLKDASEVFDRLRTTHQYVCIVEL